MRLRSLEVAPSAHGQSAIKRADWHTLAGVGAGAIALWRGRSLLVVFLVAITLTAVLRATACDEHLSERTGLPSRLGA